MKFTFKALAMARDLKAKLDLLVANKQIMMDLNADKFPVISVIGEDGIEYSILIKADDAQKVGAGLKDALGLDAHAYNPHIAIFKKLIENTEFAANDAILLAECVKLGVKVQVLDSTDALIAEIPANVIDSNLQQ